MRQINLRLSEALIGQIDELRGNVPRERFIRALVTRGVRFNAHDGFDPREYVETATGEDAVLKEIGRRLDVARGSRSRLECLLDLASGNSGNTPGRILGDS